MEGLLFHPKVVHIPIALGVLMPLVAGGLLLAWWRTWLPARAWVLAVALQAVLVGSGLLAMKTGEAQEERVERVVAKRLIEEHAEAAEVFVWASGGVLVYRHGAAQVYVSAGAAPGAPGATSDRNDGDRD